MATKKHSAEEIIPLDTEKNFLFSEAFKTLRTNLSFCMASRENHRIAVTSSLPSEGKSLVSINLAYVLAETGNKVCLVDADMRSPKVHKYLKIKNDTGLSNFLSGQANLEKCLFKTKYENLYVIKSGALPPNPAELLNGKFMDTLFDSLEKIFDYIIIDTPPMNIVSDAMVVASHKTAILFVVRENDSVHSEFKESLRNIEMANLDLIGVVINDASFEPKGGRYGKYRRYGRYKRYGYGYGYGYGSNDDDENDDLPPRRRRKAPKRKKKPEAKDNG